MPRMRFYDDENNEVPGKRLVVWLPEPEHRDLKMLAAQNGETVAETVRTLVHKFLGSYEMFQGPLGGP